MIVPFFDSKRLDSLLRKELVSAFERVVFERGIFILGEEVAAFEKSFSSYVGRKHCISVNSGTDALILTLRAMNIGRGDEVLVPANSFVASAFSVSYVGASPVFVDVDEKYYLISLTDAEKRVTGHTKAIMPVHLYGNPCNQSEIRQFAEKFNLRVIEDAAQAHGAFDCGVPLGKSGDAACFSFYPTKNLGAMGDSGAIITDDDELASRLRRLRNYGQQQKYVSEEIGINSRLDELQAAFLNCKLPLLDSLVSERREIAARYSANLEGIVDIPIERQNCIYAYHLYVIRTPNRDCLQQYLKSKGVATLIHYPIPLHKQKPYSHVHVSLPNAERLSSEILSLPIFPRLTSEEVDYVCETIKEHHVKCDSCHPCL